MERKIERLQNSLQHAEEQISTLVGENGRLLSERNNLRNKLDVLKKENDVQLLVAAKDKEAALQQANNESKVDMDKLRGDIRCANERTQECEAELLCLQNDYSKLERNANMLESSAKLHENDVNRLTKRIHELEESVWETNRLRDMVDNLSRVNKKLSVENEDLTNCLKSSVEHGEQLKSALLEAETPTNSKGTQFFSPSAAMMRHVTPFIDKRNASTVKSLFEELNNDDDDAVTLDGKDISVQENDPLFIHFRLTVRR